MNKIALKDLSLIELTAHIQRAGFPGYRGKQIFNWLFVSGAREIDDMKNLPADLKDFLKNKFIMGGIKSIEKILESKDGTKKILFRLYDDNYVEGVLMREKAWWTICISSQVGCPLDCLFCSTGKGGFIRNLSVSEILDQILITDKLILSEINDQKIRNVVFMGMGEPMLNIDNVVGALKIMLAPDGMGLSTKRITVSTSGILEGIEKLGDSETGVNLAISLNAVDNKTRERLMPVSKKYPLQRIIEQCREFPLTRRRRITFEYVMIHGINDSLKDAQKMVELLKGLPCKINLIPFNPSESFPEFKPPSDKQVDDFRKTLSNNHFTVAIRYSKGKDIMAACGQLAGHIKKISD